VIRLAPRRRQPGATFSARLGIAGVAVALLAAGCGASGETKVSTAPDPSFIKPGTLTVCTAPPYPPFELYENGKSGKIVGFDIDLVNAVARSLGVKTEVLNKHFGSISSGRVLNQNQCDVAVAALTISGDRARIVDFSSPYFSAKQAMVVRSASGISSLDDLRGGRIGVQKGSTGEIYVTDNAPPGAEIVPYEDADQIDVALDSGDLDAAVYDSTVVGDVLKRYPNFEQADSFPTGEQYGMAVKKNSSVDLLRVINRVLAQMPPGSKAYDTIFNRWFPKGTTQ
jgi:polar amino acid transport system substrate-binding protein